MAVSAAATVVAEVFDGRADVTPLELTASENVPPVTVSEREIA